MIFRCIRLIGFLCLAILVVCLTVPPSHADPPATQRDPAYEPYTLDTIRYESAPQGMRSIRTKARILPGSENRSDSILLIRALNQTPNKSGRPRFSTFSYPDWLILDEDPVPFTILDWIVFHSPASNEERVLAAGNTKNAVMVRIETPTYDSTGREQLELFTFDSETVWDDWYPDLFIVPANDIDDDGREEVLIYSSELREPRMMWCVQLEPLKLEWGLHVASPVSQNGLFVTRVKGESRIVALAGNPHNGIEDSLFSDAYGYFVVIDGEGHVLTKKVISCNYQQRMVLVHVPGSDKFFIAHSLFPSTTLDCDTVTGNGHFLSQINYDGSIEKSVALSGIPTSEWIDSRAPGGGPAVCVWTNDDSLHVYDTALTLIESRHWHLAGRYLGRTAIPKYRDSVVVFSSGIYDQNLDDRLLTFPTGASYWEPLTTESDGRVNSLLIGNESSYFVGRIRKKSAIELASVFYHRNQIYVLMLLSGLLVGLVVVNVYRHKTKSNLRLISQQKFELERTHEELKSAQAKLIAAEKYQQAQDIAGGFAHEIRNALFPADGALFKLHQISGNGNDEDIRRNQYCEHARRAVQRAIDLTKTISSYTKLEASADPDAISLHKLIEGVIESNRLRVESAGVEVANDVAAEITVSGVRQQLEIVFNNLLLNAIDAVAQVANPQIAVQASASKAGVALAWRDNGNGIREENINRVFEPFFTTKPPTGTGLGLAMVKRIVDLHGGSIRVESSEGQGTTFHIHIPGKQETINA